MRTILLSCVLLCLSAGIVWGQSGAGMPVFFEALYDVPVMPGLEEARDQAMLFDKPDGRIASVVAASKTLQPPDVTRFYDESLPQLGWKKTAKNQYIRGGDRLVMDVTRQPPLTVVRFTLSPARP